MPGPVKQSRKAREKSLSLKKSYFEQFFKEFRAKFSTCLQGSPLFLKSRQKTAEFVVHSKLSPKTTKTREIISDCEPSGIIL